MDAFFVLTGALAGVNLVPRFQDTAQLSAGKVTDSDCLTMFNACRPIPPVVLVASKPSQYTVQLRY